MSVDYQQLKGVPTFPTGGPTVGQGGGGLVQKPGTAGTTDPATGKYKSWQAPWINPVNKGGSYGAGTPISPQFTEDFTQWLSTKMGKGATPYSVEGYAPTSGKFAQPGQLTADINPMLYNAGKFLETAPYDPSMWVQPKGQQTLDEMLATGMPIDQTPAWEAMTKAMDRTYEQGRGDIRSQMAGLGVIGGTPHGQAQTDYALQAAREKAGLLGTLQTGAMESARGRQVTALGIAKDFHALDVNQQQFMIEAASKLGEVFQGLDQASIDRTLAEFIRTRPEYGPLLNFIYGLSQTFPPYLAGKTGLGTTGAVIGNIGTGAQVASDISTLIKNNK